MLKLYGFPVSNYSNMVEFALLEKGVPFEYVLTFSEQTPESYIRAAFYRKTAAGRGSLSAARLPRSAGPSILGDMSGKVGLTLFHCLIGPALVVGGLWLATQVGHSAPLAGLALALAALVFPFLIVSRVAWAAGYAAGERVRDSNPSAG